MAQPTEDEDLDFPPQDEATGKARPAARFSGSGGISVAVWKHKTEKGDHYSVRIDRSYKDPQTDSYQSTPYLRERDLLRTRELLLQADAWVEQDRAKGRQSGVSREGAGRQ